MNGLPPGYVSGRIKRPARNVIGAPPLNAGKPPCSLAGVAQSFGRANGNGNTVDTVGSPATDREPERQSGL